MSVKPTLLVIGNFNREDYIHTFKDSKQDFNFYFAEYASRKEVFNRYHEQYGQAIYWGSYSDAFKLLDKVRPSKVIFFYVESFFHVALLLACKLKGIRTYHLEHGIRDSNINIRLHDKLPVKIGSGKLKHLSNVVIQFRERFNARLFLLNTRKLLPEKEALLFKDFYRIRKKTGYLDTIAKLEKQLLWPDESISYSPKVFAVHKHFLNIPDHHPVHYVGVPMYDHLARIKTTSEDTKAILFIDQGLSNRGFFGWNEKTFGALLKTLSDLAAQYKFRLHIKPHPTHTSYRKRYAKTLAKGSAVIDDSQLELLLPAIPVVIGFFSTLLLPLASFKHTTLITLENHPAGKLDVSKSFIDAGVAHPIYNLKELPWALEHIEELHQQQLPNKKRFEEEWLYKFDGKAGERLRDILLGDNL